MTVGRSSDSPLDICAAHAAHAAPPPTKRNSRRWHALSVPKLVICEPKSDDSWMNLEHNPYFMGTRNWLVAGVATHLLFVMATSD